VTTQTELRNYVWQACTAIRNEHRDVKKYVEYTAVLLFFKFYDDLYYTLPEDIQGLISEKYRWHSLKALDPRGFSGYHPEVLIRLHDFFENKRWKGKRTFGVIFDNFQFDIKHDEVLGRALLNIDRINFAGMAYDQKGDIYEFLIGRMAHAGVKGEFFTPRPIVNTIIEILKPRFGLKVWDPACGTGGFLSRAFEEMLANLRNKHRENLKRHQEELQTLRYNSIYGNETESVSARLARMNMILRGDGHSTILEFNSLDKQTYSEARLKIRGQTQNNPIPDILDQGGFDLIMANPPYGGSQAVSDVGSHSWFKPWQKSKKPEANFLQVMMHALKPGGRCGVLMPEGILFRRDEIKIRERLLKDFHLEAIVGLFKGAFESVDVKACILFFRKPTKAEKWKGTQQVWIAETKSFTDIQEIPSRFANCTEDNLARTVGIDEIREKRLVLRPNKYLKASSDVSATHISLGEIFEEVKDTIPIKTTETYRQVTVKLHGRGAVLRGEVLGSEIAARRQKQAREGDLIVSKIDARNGALALIPPDLDGAIVSQDFPLFRRKGADLFPPESCQLLLELFRYYLQYSPLTYSMELDAQGTTNRRRVTVDEVLDLTMPCPREDEQRKLLERLNNQRNIVERAQLLLEDVFRLNWLDEAIFHVAADEVLATSFEPLVEDASEYIDPSRQPETEWQLYSLSNVNGIFPGTKKLGTEFSRGRKYKRVIENAIAYTTTRVDVGSVGIMPAADQHSIISPYRVVFRCKEHLDAKFALYLIKSPFFRRLISETQVGAIRDELFFSVFTDIEVPIPQLTRQREIVRYIETQLSAYSQVRLLRDQAEVTMRKLIYHLFGQSYTGDRTDTLDTADSYLQDDTENWEAIATTESLA
jgi:type I restriction enzyme M protein